MSNSPAPKRVARPKTAARVVRPAAAETTPSATPSAAPSADMIAARAYQLWLAEGCPDGRDLAHWSQAEHELAG